MSNPNNNLKGKRIVRTTSRAVDNIVLLTLLVILMMAAYALYDTHVFLNSASSNIFTEYKPETEEEAQSFEELRAINPDVIGWLTIYDTTIDYPVLRSPNSNFDYLSKNALGEWEGSGSLFLDHDNKADFSDFNTIIYGHHMAGPAMFGQLDAFLDKDFFEKHEYANLFFSDTGLQLVQETPSTGVQVTGLHYEFVTFAGKNRGIQIFAMIQADGNDSAIYRVPSSTPEAKQVTLDSIASHALLARNLNTGEVKQLAKASAGSPSRIANVDSSFFGVSTDDTIVLMSTCSAEITNGRFVLVGKLLDHEVENQFPDEEESNSQYSIDLYSIMDNILKLPLWQWILILIALIVIIGLLYFAEKHRLKKKQARKNKQTK